MIKDLRPRRGKEILPPMIEEGEHEHQDFKFAISDARKIARSISAFANNDGGRLLVGVKDNGVIAGVRSDEDIYVVEQAAEMYCVPPQEIDVRAYQVEGNVVYQVDIQPAGIGKPVQVVEEGNRRRAYYRVADENISAHSLMVKAWMAQRKALGNTSGILITEAEQRLLAVVGECGDEGASLNELHTMMRVSRATAERALINAYMMGLIDFASNGNEFTALLRN